MLMRITKRYEHPLDKAGNQVRVFPAGGVFEVDAETAKAIKAAHSGESLSGDEDPAPGGASLGESGNAGEPGGVTEKVPPRTARTPQA